MSTILFIIGGALVAIGISAFVIGRAQHITATARGRDVETAPFAAATSAWSPTSGASRSGRCRPGYRW